MGERRCRKTNSEFPNCFCFFTKAAVAAVNDLPFRVLIEKCGLIRKEQAVIAGVNVLRNAY
jgi:hypothetical protein